MYSKGSYRRRYVRIILGIFAMSAVFAAAAYSADTSPIITVNGSKASELLWSFLDSAFRVIGSALVLLFAAYAKKQWPLAINSSMLDKIVKVVDMGIDYAEEAAAHKYKKFGEKLDDNTKLQWAIEHAEPLIRKYKPDITRDELAKMIVSRVGSRVGLGASSSPKSAS